MNMAMEMTAMAAYQGQLMRKAYDILLRTLLTAWRMQVPTGSVRGIMSLPLVSPYESQKPPSSRVATTEESSDAPDPPFRPECFASAPPDRGRGLYGRRPGGRRLCPICPFGARGPAGGQPAQTGSRGLSRQARLF